MKKFSAFDPVLIRTGSTAPWTADFYDRTADDGKGHWCVTGTLTKDKDILPYNEETKHLHNTIGEFTKWEPKKGEPILVRDYVSNTWTLRIFLGMRNDRYICTSDPSIAFSQASCAGWECAKPYINPFEE